MKKIITILLLLISISLISVAIVKAAGSCWDIDKEKLTSSSVSQLLGDCEPKWALQWAQKKELWSFLWITVSTTDNEGYEIANAKWKVMAITNKLVILAAILAIGWIVYAGFLFTTAYWNNDKLKKAKESLKWSLLWLLIAIVSQQLVNAVINLVYWISG
ncbi:MAG: hypothetical protein ACD_2C00165G0003 [uncultured bacterium (gcode 4)]|uniref:Uncharacterized protein n=1 Tax=uncultured bacterium (gcode 4) TaxID=1234023 RepID=K2G5B5_9BACT|nr:MAG: hypothetical protein ACD_2C00165G0003 [uncultured bacterium (gcode 4)]